MMQFAVSSDGDSLSQAMAPSWYGVEGPGGKNGALSVDESLLLICVELLRHDPIGTNEYAIKWMLIAFPLPDLKRQGELSGRNRASETIRIEHSLIGPKERYRTRCYDPVFI